MDPRGESSAFSPVDDLSPMRWIRYLSPERHTLWSEQPDAPLPDHDGDEASVLDASEWQDVLDAAFVTRLPQSRRASFSYNGRDCRFSLKAFPDFGVGGQFKGVIQVVELVRDRGRPRSATDAVAARNREVHSVLDLTLNGVVLYRPDTDIIQNVNRRFAQETGYPVRELETMSGRTLFGNDGAALLKNIHSRLATAGDGIVWGQILSIRNRLGQRDRYCCSISLVPPTPDNHEERILYISLDVLEKDAPAWMRESGPNPRFVLEALQEGLWEYDGCGNTFHYSRCFSDIFGDDGLPGAGGMPADEWLGAMYPGEPAKVLDNWRRLLKNGDRYRTCYRIRDRKGEWHWLVSTIHAILNDTRGRPKRVIGFHMDITDAMHSEQNLSDTEERLRIIFENSGVGIALAGTDGAVARANPALALMLGRNRDEFGGRHLAEFAHPDQCEELTRSARRLAKSGRREHLQDILFMRPDGRKVWINLTASLSRKVSDGDRYIVVTAEDVTASHANREKLQYEATHDVMTGAWSRWVMLERLDQHILLAQRHHQPMAFCLCDLDHFKQINDTHGHQAGDRVLVRFVEVLKNNLRDTDIVGRYGGEEFGVVLPNTPVAGARELFGRIQGAFGRERFTAPGGGEFAITFTAGISGVVPGCDAKRVVAWADGALYEGKGAGRDRIVVAAAPAGKWME